MGGGGEDTDRVGVVESDWSGGGERVQGAGEGFHGVKPKAGVAVSIKLMYYYYTWRVDGKKIEGLNTVGHSLLMFYLVLYLFQSVLLCASVNIQVELIGKAFREIVRVVNIYSLNI